MSSQSNPPSTSEIRFHEGGPLPFPIPELLSNAETLLLAREEERRAAPEQCEEIQALSELQIVERLDADPQFPTWGLTELFIDQSRQSIFSAQPSQAVHRARVATLIAERVDTATYGQALVADLATQAWGALANAYRIAGCFSESQAAFEEADRWLLSGTGDPLEAASLLSLLASLRMDLGEYDTAIDLLDEVVAMYQEIDDTLLLGRTLLKKAIAIGVQDAERGLRVLPDAYRHLDPAEDPRTFLCARHTQILLLNDAGRALEADQLLETSRPLYRQVGGDWLHLRLAWLEAKICCSLGRLDEADAGLSVILSEVLERKLHLEAALAALDLAACRILQGRTAEAYELARSMAGLFEAWGVHRRALEAWSVVQHALATETATVTLLRDVAGYFTRAWRNPEIPFVVSI